jgi:hypothetical protein
VLQVRMSLNRRILPLLLLFSTVLGLAGCVVREREVVRPVPACRGGVWVEGHYGPAGRWHPAHWRCPGVVEEEVIVRP